MTPTEHSGVRTSIKAWFGEHYVTEYLFFIRYPVILGLVLLLVPWLGPVLAPDSLNNIFVLDPIGAGLATYFALIAAWGVVYTALLIIASLPNRCRLPFRRADRDEYLHEQMPPPDWIFVETAGKKKIVLMQPRYIVFGALLAAPVALSVIIRHEGHLGMTLGFVAIGAALGLLTRYLGVWLSDLWERSMQRRAAKNVTSASPEQAPVRGEEANTWLAGVPLVGNIYDNLPLSIQILHGRAAAFFGLTLFVYAITGLLTSPDVGELWRYFPALTYVMLLITMLTWFLGLAAFIFDRGRIPVVIFILVFILVGQSIAPNDRTFLPTQWRGPAQPLPSISEAIETRWQRHLLDPDLHPRPLIVIAASGGGITASYWTACVLEELEREVPGLSDSIALVSSVSGGGIAAMLLADAYSESAPPKDVALKRIREDSARSTLGAVGWGMAYPDLWRTLVPFFNAFGMDRGVAQDRAWARLLADRDRTLGDWAQGTIEGWRPVQVFNVTQQETGGRLLLAPLPYDRRDEYAYAWSQGPTRMRRDLFDFLPDGDIRVATATRLSATFPFISPQSRPASGSLHHASDGGYFDNSGLVSAMELVDEFLTNTLIEDLDERQIIFIEIRAAQSAEQIASTAGDATQGALFNAMLGPLSTLYNARTATQISRTQMEFELLEDFWEDEHGIDVFRHTFVLSGSPPLSWRLTRCEKQFIRSHWPGVQLAIECRDGMDSGATKEWQSAIEVNREALESIRSEWQAFDPGSAPIEVSPSQE